MKKSTWTLMFRFGLIFLLIHICFYACTQDNFKNQRMTMVQTQIMARGITDENVVHAMQTVERHLFVPAQAVPYAYRDGPLSIGYGQTISQPYIVAYMTEILNLKRSDKVLEIGTGSGYQAAILGELCDSVFTIEIVSELGNRAKNLLEVLGYTGINVKIGDGYQGWTVHAPFDAIIVTCAPTHIPIKLQEQLKEGGRMIIPVGQDYVQKLVLLEKRKGEIHQKSVLPVRFVPMVDEGGELY